MWDPSTLPQGVREAVSRRLSRLPVETNKALAAAAVVGSRFAVELVERVVDQDLVDAFDEACKAGIVIEEPGGRYRFNHALIRQSLLAELRIRAADAAAPAHRDDAGERARRRRRAAGRTGAPLLRMRVGGKRGQGRRVLQACRRPGDGPPGLRGRRRPLRPCPARARGARRRAARPRRPDRRTAGRALRGAAGRGRRRFGGRGGRAAAGGDARFGSSCGVGDVLRRPAVDAGSPRAAGRDRGGGAERPRTSSPNWTTPQGKPRRTPSAPLCLARLGRIGDCEIALDHALTAARRAREHRRVNAVLAGAPLAALWGPNPVPRAGGRCLDVVRLLRITTDSPAVEATSTRCQAVLEAFRGRAAAASG